MRPVGFSTGALAKADFRLALHELEGKTVNSIELSALRYRELPVLLESLTELPLDRYRYVAIHAPSQFDQLEEGQVVKLLKKLVPAKWPIIVHPDTIHSFELWRTLGSRIAIENMDRRKAIGRTAEELKTIFDKLPEAQLCFDIGHARQFDTTMTEAYRILKLYTKKLCQVHVSEVNSASQHDPVSFTSILAFSQVANLISATVPLIIESRVQPSEIENEILKMSQAFPLSAIAASITTLSIQGPRGRFAFAPQ
jgi:hypothetical protein